MKKLQHYFWICLAISGVCFFMFKVGKRFLTDHLLENNSQHIKGVIISEKNFEGNQPVNPQFSYSYKFTVDGKEYIGNAHNRSVNVGDTVEVEYVKSWPGLNRPLHPTD
ncbi:MAG: hypothetical protein V4560_07305 [Bacteroidota bacterium]